MTTDTPTPILTPAQVAEILARCEAATVGPWTHQKHHGCKNILAPSGGSRNTREIACTSGLSDEREDRANAAFVTNARTDIPALCATVEALRFSHAVACEEWDNGVVLVRERDKQIAAQARRIEALEAGLRDIHTMYRRLESAHDNVIHDEEDRTPDSITEDEYERIRNECLYTIMRTTRALLAEPKPQEGAPHA